MMLLNHCLYEPCMSICKHACLCACMRVPQCIQTCCIFICHYPTQCMPYMCMPMFCHTFLCGCIHNTYTCTRTHMHTTNQTAISMSVCLAILDSVQLHICFVYICLSNYLSVCLSSPVQLHICFAYICLSKCLSVCLLDSLMECAYIFLSVCLPACSRKCSLFFSIQEK
jgi:hypothetical protein